MKTDTIFYRLFQSCPSIFFELINQPPESANAYQFSSVEVKQLSFRIERIIVYKFPQKNWEEIEQMLGLGDFKQTRVYQETAEEVKSEAVPRFLALGLSVEQIAQGLDLEVEQVRQVAVSHMLKSGMSVEQVADTLSLDIDLVRQIEASNARE